MVAFGHTAVGVLVGVASYQAFSSGDIASGLVLTGAIGVLSHYLMDTVPHGHYFTDMAKYERLIIWVIIFDLLLPILFILGLMHYLGRSGTEILYVLFGIGGAQLPDVIEGLKALRLLPDFKLLRIENRIHTNTHWHGKAEKALLWGLRDIWQVAVFVLAILVIIFYS